MIEWLRGAVLCGGLIGCAAAPAHPPAAAAPSRGALHAQGMAAYQRQDFAACGELFERAEDPYSAACCHARAARLDAAFAALARAVADGFDQDLTRDDDLAALRGDPRWSRTLADQAARAAAHERALNGELLAIYKEDQADRAVTSYEQIDWSKVAPRDQARRARVDALVASGVPLQADDFFHAAMVYQHGDSVAEITRARELALRAVALDARHKRARWLAAAAEDRALMYQHKAQKWGTQFKKVDGKWIVWPVDPAVTDAQREAWNVPPLAEAEGRVAEMNARLEAAAKP